MNQIHIKPGARVRVPAYMLADVPLHTAMIECEVVRKSEPMFLGADLDHDWHADHFVVREIGRRPTAHVHVDFLFPIEAGVSA